MAAVFTAIGAFVGPALGEIGFWVALFGGLITIFALPAAREIAPLNLILLILFATVEGVVLGQVLELYVSQGLSLIVFQAAAATATEQHWRLSHGRSGDRDRRLRDWPVHPGPAGLDGHLGGFRDPPFCVPGF